MNMQINSDEIDHKETVRQGNIEGLFGPSAARNFRLCTAAPAYVHFSSGNLLCCRFWIVLRDLLMYASFEGDDSVLGYLIRVIYV